MDDILNYCIEYRNYIYRTTNDYPDEIPLTNNQRSELLGCCEFLGSYSSQPKPPVVEVTENIKSNLFGSETIVTRKFDFQDPTYLQACIDAAKDNNEFLKSFPMGKIYGMKVIEKEC